MQGKCSRQLEEYVRQEKELIKSYNYIHQKHIEDPYNKYINSELLYVVEEYNKLREQMIMYSYYDLYDLIIEVKFSDLKNH